MTINIEILDETKNSTLSTLKIGDTFLGVVIQNGYRESKVYGETRIPSGEYLAEPVVISDEIFLKYKSLGRNPVKAGKKASSWIKSLGVEFLPILTNVPNFKGIIAHAGNKVIETDGCPLLNKGFVKVAGNYEGRQSKICVVEVCTYIQKEWEKKEDVWFNMCQ